MFEKWCVLFFLFFFFKYTLYYIPSFPIINKFFLELPTKANIINISINNIKFFNNLQPQVYKLFEKISKKLLLLKEEQIKKHTKENTALFYTNQSLSNLTSSY